MSEYPDRSGMKVSAEGLLKRVAAIVKQNDEQGRGYAFTLDEMLRHLTELAERFYAGDIAVVDEFLQTLARTSPKQRARK